MLSLAARIVLLSDGMHPFEVRMWSREGQGHKRCRASNTFTVRSTAFEAVDHRGPDGSVLSKAAHLCRLQGAACPYVCHPPHSVLFLIVVGPPNIDFVPHIVQDMPPVKEKDSPDGEPRQRKRPGRVPVSCAECRRYVRPGLAECTHELTHFRVQGSSCVAIAR